MRVRRPLSVRSKLLASVALVGLLLAAVGAVVQSAFTSTVQSTGNSFEAGSITLSGSVARTTPLFDLKGMKPGPVSSRCLKVTYSSTGGLASSVKLYGTVGGTLPANLKVRITRGSFSGAPPADGGCAGFAASSSTLLYDNTLARFPSSWSTGLADVDANWTDGESAVYRIDVELADTDYAQGASATAELTFEARSA